MTFPSKTCIICSNDFNKKSTCSVKTWGNSRFCSRKCADKWRTSKDFGSLISSRRKGQGNFRNGIRLSEETKRKMSLASIGKKKSLIARERMSQAKKGKYCKENHPGWKGGIKRKYIGKIERWRRHVLERDNGCMFPGCDNQDKLHVHHIVPYSKNKELSVDNKNGIILCKSCHYKTFNKEKYYEKLFTEISLFQESIN